MLELCLGRAGETGDESGPFHKGARSCGFSPKHTFIQRRKHSEATAYVFSRQSSRGNVNARIVFLSNEREINIIERRAAI